MEHAPSSVRPLIAILDDDVHFCRAARQLLEPEFEVETFVEEEGLLRSLKFQEPDLLLLDVGLGEAGDTERTGFEVFETLRAGGFTFPVVILTVRAGMDVTSRAVALGLPFLQKDASFSPEVFQGTVRRVLEDQRVRRELDYRRWSMRLPGETTECPWPDSPEGRQVTEALQPFLEGELPLLLEGETGTGKRTTASWFHHRTRGPAAPFVALLDAGGLREEQVEAELFGSEVGEFPAPNGLLRSAEGGTVYVGGFGRLPAHTVARLTEAVQSGFYLPIGSQRRRRLAARLVAGTDARVADRSDWAESLRAFWKPLRVGLPALRQHPGDIPFHLDFLARSLRLHKPVAATASTADLAALQSLPLPGNFNDLRLYLIQGLKSVERSASLPAGAEPDWDRLADMSKMQFDDYVLRRYLQGVMKRHGRNFEAWQEHTGYSRSTIFGWWKYLGEE